MKMKILKFAAVAAMASVMTLGAETLDCGDFARNWKVHQWDGFIPLARFATENGVLSIREANARAGAGYVGPRFKCTAGDIVHLRYEMRGKGKGAAWLQLVTTRGAANGCLADKRLDLTSEWKTIEVTVSIENGSDGETGEVGLCCGCTKGSEADFRNFSCEIDRCFFDDFENNRERSGSPRIVTRDIAPGLLSKTKMGSYRTAETLEIQVGTGSFELPETDEVNPYLEFGMRPYDLLGGRVEYRLAGGEGLVLETKGEHLVASFAGRKLEMPYGTLPADFLLRVSKTGAFDLTVKSLADSSTHAMKGECDLLKGRSEPVTAAIRLVRTGDGEAELVVDNLRAGRASLKPVVAPAPIRIERSKTFDPRKAGWPLVFEDDFNGNEIDRSKWYHWNSKVWPERAFVTNGLLHVLCDWDEKHEKLTSAALWSAKAQKYGFFEARVRFTKKRGWWAAFWLYGDSDANPFADGFEIDGFEDYYTRPRDRSKPNEPILDHNLHINNGKHLKSWNYNSRLPGSLDDFYTLGVKWTPFEISYYLDGKLISSKSTHSDYDSVTFDAVTHAAGITPLHAIVSGQIMKPGWWATDVDGETFPDHYLVDYVRIYAYPEEPAKTPTVKLVASDPGRMFVKPGEKVHFKAEVTPASADKAPIRTVYLYDDGYLLDYRSEPPYEFDVTFTKQYFDSTSFAKAGRSGQRRELDNHPHYFVVFAQDEKGRVGQSGRHTCVMAEREKAKPFEGKAQTVPGKIAVGRFDEGGNGVGWHDQTPAENTGGGKWRQNEGVDGSEHSIGSVNTGEWLNYTVDVQKDGYYRATFNYGSPLRDPFTVALVCDGRLLGRFRCQGHDQDGGWAADSKAVLSKLPLKAGRHQLSVVLEGRCNFGDLEFEPENE